MYIVQVSDELRRYGYNPWLPATAKWGKILPWTFTADDASDIFNVRHRFFTKNEAYSVKKDLTSLPDDKIKKDLQTSNLMLLK